MVTLPDDVPGSKSVLLRPLNTATAKYNGALLQGEQVVVTVNWVRCSGGWGPLELDGRRLSTPGSEL